jgi:inosine-uridine nucleoside N-ribohydrolase
VTASALIIDTDIGGEPDDAMAIAIAARHLPQLALVLTTDEKNGQRARLVRHYLELLGRHDVAVAAGHTRSSRPYFWIEDLIPDRIPSQSHDIISAVSALCKRISGNLYWLGLGPMTNLASVLSIRPDLADRMRIVQMGGALNYRDPSLAQYNFRLDPSAAMAVIASNPTHLHLVTYDVTFMPQLAIHSNSALYEDLSSASEPWTRLLADQCDRYFDAYYPSTIPHTPLALSALMGEPFVHFAPRRIIVDGLGRTRESRSGQQVMLSTGADHGSFGAWLARALTEPLSS